MSKGGKKRPPRPPRPRLDERVDNGMKLAGWSGPIPLDALWKQFHGILAEAKRLDVVASSETSSALAATVAQPKFQIESPERDWRGRAEHHLCLCALLLEQASAPTNSTLHDIAAGHALPPLLAFLHGYLMGAADVELTRTKKTIAANKGDGDKTRLAVLNAARPLVKMGKTMPETVNRIANRAAARRAGYEGCPHNSGTVWNILSAEVGKDGWDAFGAEEAN